MKTTAELSLAKLAMEVAMRAHAGQTRRDGVTPYITHPMAVAAALAMESGEVVAAALLHDVLEDTKETPATLHAAGIPDSVIKSVTLLTKKKGVSYAEYLGALKLDAVARKVKIADMLHNLSDTPTERQVAKYAKGLLVLVGDSK